MRLIDADGFLDRNAEFANREFIHPKYQATLRELIDSEPTLSPDEVRGVGEWEDAQQHGLVRCSVCKDCYIERDYITQAKWKYCPSCGARMTRAEAEKAMEVRG